jgi:hypothetical protein
VAVVAHAVVTPDRPSPSPAPEQVLDTRPSQRAAPQPDSPVQDIHLQIPADDGGAPLPAITATFHMDAADLAAEVAVTADLAFVASGTDGVEAFGDALNGTAVPIPYSLVSELVPTRGEKRYISDRATPFRARLKREFEAYERRLPERRAAAEAAVQELAVAAALGRLEASRAQVVTEARRYLSLANTASAAATVLSQNAGNLLSGPDTLALVGDLIAIANERLRLAGLTATRDAVEREWEQTKIAMVTDDRARVGLAPRYMTDAQIRQVWRDVAALPDSPELVQAKQRVVDQHEALAQVVSARATLRPVLYRLWDTDIPFIARRVIRNARGTNAVVDRAAVIDSDDLRHAVVGQLRTAFQAATELIRKLGSDPELVWRFEPLIEDALTQLNADASEFVARAARERVLDERPGSDLAEWSMWLGIAQLGFALTGVAPIVVGLTVAQAAVDLGAAAMKAFAAAEQQLGEDAFLRPSARLGVPPSYSGAVMDALDVAIGVINPLPFDTKLFRDD